MPIQKPFLAGFIFFAVTGCLTASQITFGQNAILNGNAEAGVGSTDGGIVKVPDWTATGQFTAVQYGASGGFPSATDPGPTNRGNNFFAGGPSSALSSGTQVVDVSNVAPQISSGASYTLSGFLGGFDGQDDNAMLTANFMDGGSLIGSTSIGPVTEADRSGLTGLLFRTTSGLIPVGTTSIDFDLVLTRAEGSYDDGYADNLSFVATAGSAAPAPEPASINLLAGSLLGFCSASARLRAIGHSQARDAAAPNIQDIAPPR